MQDRLEALLQFHREDPADTFTRFALATEYRRRGETDRALSFYEQLVADDPAYVGTYYHLGKLYEEMDRTEDALGVYRAGIRVAGEQRDTHARAELQSALLEAQGIGFDDEA